LITVDPTGALLPFASEQDELTGAVPPVTVGAANEIATGFPSGEVTD
jgi:hypothetical protein